VRFDVFTLFPEWFDWMRRPRHLANAALTAGLEVRCFSPRDTTPLPNGQVDDAPYGGGPGMVIRADVMAAALAAVYGEPADRVRDRRRVVVLTPRGRPFDDAVARELAGEPEIALLCGRYEGFDERVHEVLANDAISLGPFVLAGGEVAAMAVIDAVARRLEGALGNAESLDAESFSPALGGGLEHPHYTRPAEVLGHGVPPVLLSGDHGAVARWRAEHVLPPPSGSSGPRGPRGPLAMLPLVLPGIDPGESKEEHGR
jgi:tRNA (guanine37-N1)-methyltransferase